MPDGSLWTGYYSDWAQMSSDDKQVVLDTRKKNKGKTPTKGRHIADVGSKLTDIKSQMVDLKRTIAALSATKSDADDNDPLRPTMPVTPLGVVRARNKERMTPTANVGRRGGFKLPPSG